MWFKNGLSWKFLNQDGFGRHKFLVFWLVYVQHKNIIAIGWQQTREQKHVVCQFAPGANSPRSPLCQKFKFWKFWERPLFDIREYAFKIN